jgi:hypothetical protein
MVSQVPIIGILMIVNGSLQVLLSLVYLILVPFVLADRGFGGFGRFGGFGGDERLFMIIMIVMGILVLATGVMNIIGGILGMKYHGRGFIITALFMNILPLCTIYCLPTSLGLMIWGLIVMFNGETARAFAYSAEGHSPSEVKSRFGGGGRPQRDDRYDDRYDDGYGDR